MNKILQFTIISILMSIALMSVASATIFVNNDVFRASFDQSGNFLTTTHQVTQVQAMGFVCMNADCSQVGQRIFNEQTLHSHGTNRIQTFFPNTPLYQSDYGYGVVYFKDGYIPYAQRIRAENPRGGDTTVSQVQNVYLSQLQMCRSVIDTFSVVNEVHPNQPLMIDVQASLDSTVHSPIAFAGPINYRPAELQRQYQVKTQIVLEILDAQGNVVNTQTKDVYVDFSGSKQVQFSYTPTHTGDYTARVTSTTTDGKCADSQSHFSQKVFAVIHPGEREMCYALVQNLKVQPEYVVENTPVQVQVDYIANNYDRFGALRSMGADLQLIVQKDGQQVHSQTRSTAPHVNVHQYRTESFTFTPTQSGYYAYSVIATARDCQYSRSLNDQISQSHFVNNEPSDPVDPQDPTVPNEPPVFTQIPVVELVRNSGLNENIFTLQTFVFDPDGDQLTFTLVSQSRTDRAECTVSSSGMVSCTAKNELGQSIVTVSVTDGTNTIEGSFIVEIIEDDTIDPVDPVDPTDPNKPPVFTQIPTQVLPGISFFQTRGLSTIVEDILVLSDFASDPDGDTLTFQIIEQSRPDIVQCSLTADTKLHCDVKADFGESVIEVRVSDGELTDTTQFVVRVDSSIFRTEKPMADFPDVELVENSGLNVGIFNFFDFITHPYSNSLVVYWNLTQSHPEIVDCFVDGSTLSCDVQPNMTGSSEIEVWFATFKPGVQRINSQTFTVTVIPSPNIPPESTIPDVSIKRNEQDVQLFDLLQLVTNPMNTTLSFRIVEQSNTDIGVCRIEQESFVVCSAGTNRIGSSTIIVEITDGLTTIFDSFRLRVEQDFAELTPTRSREDVHLKIQQVRIPDVVRSAREYEFPMTLWFENDGNVELTSARAVISIPELGIIMPTTQFSLRPGQTVTRVVQMPLYGAVQPGIYTVRITTNSDQSTQRVIHREVVIQ